MSGHFEFESQQGQSKSLVVPLGTMPILAQSVMALPVSSMLVLAAPCARTEVPADAIGPRASERAISIARMVRR